MNQISNFLDFPLFILTCQLPSGYSGLPEKLGQLSENILLIRESEDAFRCPVSCIFKLLVAR